MRLFLDACVVIYWVESVDPWYQRLISRLTLLATDAGSVDFSVSALTRLECRVKPLRDRDRTLLGRYDSFFVQPSLRTVALDQDVVDVATILRADYGLKTPDALQAACAIRADAILLTNDRRFSTVPRLRTEAV